MTYQALARKWRPQTFADLVGQEAIVTALRNALRDGRIAQAYLFSGIRGVGKTTAARVLAKALNCLGADGSAKGPVSEPCDTCLVCTEIRDAGDLDVIEIDAATYSKVEQVRDLTESLRYGPARDRYKVVVLDEVHRLSASAFDALLKIVEEPPPHLTFIFATTEIEKVPATVLSRCQEFHFRRVPPEPMVAHLRRICDAEDFEAGGPALRLIARASEGSVRDAVALLDQLATFGNGRLDDEDVGRLLGGIDAALLSALLEAILAGDGARVSTTIREVEDGGSDPRQVFTHFLGYLRSALHLAQGLDPELLDLPAEAAADLQETAAAAGYENLLRLLHLLLSSETVVRRADAPGLALEVALLRAAELPRLVRIERLAAGLPADAEPQGAGPPGARTEAPAPRSDPAEAPAEASPPGDAAPVVKRLESESPLLAGLLDFHHARLELRGNTLVIEAGPELKRALQDETRTAQLDDAVRFVVGPDAGWKVTPAVPGGTAAPSPAAAAPPPRSAAPPQGTATRREPVPQAADRKPARRAAGPGNEARRAAEADPGVRAVLDVFGGRVLDVRPKTP
ncbi:MAG: DNA polymerase III subunit gamma/tau [Holophagales bacterium]|nr:DNA polymerase III subunit gamma/tau [Holophagales bacterium]MYG30985.1 DNA polymerase III subunit gamma/tau [Holophagales bacterium]MYI80277.1 DNA polymerase III subunit gamma/tau [Holophagales bacterium]